MENASFTKGPWRAHQGWADPWISLDRNRHPNWCEITLDGDLNGREFLSISGHFGIANARLIAAAPDLYEALKTVDYLLNELADERTPANVEMTPAEAALVAFRKHTRAALSQAQKE